MARFVIADLSDAKSILQELRGVVPDLPSVPVQPLILASQDEPGMFDFFRRYHWVLTPYQYATQEHLLTNLDACVVAPAEAKARDLQRAQPPAPAPARSYLVFFDWDKATPTDRACQIIRVAADNSTRVHTRGLK